MALTNCILLIFIAAEGMENIAVTERIEMFDLMTVLSSFKMLFVSNFQ